MQKIVAASLAMIRSAGIVVNYVFVRLIMKQKGIFLLGLEPIPIFTRLGPTIVIAF